jgi:hypothetical protein
MTAVIAPVTPTSTHSVAFNATIRKGTKLGVGDIVSVDFCRVLDDLSFARLVRWSCRRRLMHAVGVDAGN